MKVLRLAVLTVSVYAVGSCIIDAQTNDTSDPQDIVTSGAHTDSQTWRRQYDPVIGFTTESIDLKIEGDPNDYLRWRATGLSSTQQNEAATEHGRGEVAKV